MADPAHARRTAQRFVRALAANGTTSALVFGSHFPDAQEALFEEAERPGCGSRAGSWSPTATCAPDLEVTPERRLRRAAASCASAGTAAAACATR